MSSTTNVSCFPFPHFSKNKLSDAEEKLRKFTKQSTSGPLVFLWFLGLLSNLNFQFHLCLFRVLKPVIGFHNNFAPLSLSVLQYPLPRWGILQLLQEL